jgi:GT2 family glycosyltransferase
MTLSQLRTAPTVEFPLPDAASARIGVVVIGRNEGDRLGHCFDSLPEGVPVVYVDSASRDRSVDIAKQRGFRVVEIDARVPLSAARARNEGLAHLLEGAPDLRYVQFVDGDSVLEPGWLEAATEVLDRSATIVAVHGWVRERFPERSTWNRLCDIEWKRTPPGEKGAFGGNVMVRTQALLGAGRWNPKVIAAEDDELYLRLRANGGRVVKLDYPMVAHDAAMARLSQWWRRSVRTGHAYAQVRDIHGRGRDRYFAAQTRRIWLWGIAVPAAALGLSPPTLGLSLLLFGLYPLQAARIAWTTRRMGVSRRDAVAYGVVCVLARFAEAAGLVTYHGNRLLGRQTRIIEHKS